MNKTYREFLRESLAQDYEYQRDNPDIKPWIDAEGDHISNLDWKDEEEIEKLKRLAGKENRTEEEIEDILMTVDKIFSN